ncbi:MAG: Jag N-terminus, partial [Gaiellales bacterium]|nr:Jag N-terminus [Gaiellales bacterium]
MSEMERVEVETSGETVGEARWAALHELERRFPSLQRDDVQFVVLTEGERGLLGVGYKPARVLASVEVDPAATVVAPAPMPAPRGPAPADESPPAARVRDLLERVLEALAIDGRLDLV